jgi:hypothetical protein
MRKEKKRKEKKEKTVNNNEMRVQSSIQAGSTKRFRLHPIHEPTTDCVSHSETAPCQPQDVELILVKQPSHAGN